jgi:hypothetical protein
MEAFFALQRDRQQRQGLIAAQLAERQQLQQQIRDTRHSHARQILELHRQAANYRLMSDRAQGSERGSSRAIERQRGRLQRSVRGCGAGTGAAAWRAPPDAGANTGTPGNAMSLNGSRAVAVFPASVVDASRLPPAGFHHTTWNDAFPELLAL